MGILLADYGCYWYRCSGCREDLGLRENPITTGRKRGRRVGISAGREKVRRTYEECKVRPCDIVSVVVTSEQRSAITSQRESTGRYILGCPESALDPICRQCLTIIAREKRQLEDHEVENAKITHGSLSSCSTKLIIASRSSSSDL